MNIAELLKATPQDLAKRQEKELRHYVVDKLNNFTTLIANGLYFDAVKALACSPSGDECGSNNRYIDFGELELDTQDGTNIGVVLDKLLQLQKINDK